MLRYRCLWGLMASASNLGHGLNWCRLGCVCCSGGACRGDDRWRRVRQLFQAREADDVRPEPGERVPVDVGSLDQAATMHDPLLRVLRMSGSENSLRTGGLSQSLRLESFRNGDWVTRILDPSKLYHGGVLLRLEVLPCFGEGGEVGFGSPCYWRA